MSLIRIEHLYFTYDGGSEPVFEDLDLQLDTDWKLGLVGRNGRGTVSYTHLPKYLLLMVLSPPFFHKKSPNSLLCS